MKEQEKYKQMMDEIHVSEATLRKVMDMDRNKKIANKRKMMKRVGTIAAALLLCLGASNGISYAKTGHSLMAKVIFYINGEKVEKNVAFDESGNGSISFEVKEPTKGECSVEVGGFEVKEPTKSEGSEVGDAADENGNDKTYEVQNGEGSIEFKESTKGKNSVEVGNAVDENGNSISSDVSSEKVEMLDGTVISKNGKQFFKYGKEEVDITEDLADGKASGTIESSGEKYYYEVTGKDGNYSVSVKSEK